MLFREGSEMYRYVWDHFEKTPVVMSTYLLAFSVNDYERIAAEADEENVELDAITHHQACTVLVNSQFNMRSNPC